MHALKCLSCRHCRQRLRDRVRCRARGRTHRRQVGVLHSAIGKCRTHHRLGGCRNRCGNGGRSSSSRRATERVDDRDSAPLRPLDRFVPRRFLSPSLLGPFKCRQGRGISSLSVVPVIFDEGAVVRESGWGRCGSRSRLGFRRSCRVGRCGSRKSRCSPRRRHGLHSRPILKGLAPRRARGNVFAWAPIPPLSRRKSGVALWRDVPAL